MPADKEKEMAATDKDPIAAKPLEWEIIGLQKSDDMPIQYGGRSYNLARLTPEDAAFLLEQGPDLVPYIRRK